MSRVSTVNDPVTTRTIARPRHSERGASRETEEIERLRMEIAVDFRNGVSITARESSLQASFDELAERWRDETRFISSIQRLIAHPAYRAVVDLGEEVVPILLKQLTLAPEPWFAALRELTGEDPVNPQQRGDIRAMAAAWIAWGRERGLLR